MITTNVVKDPASACMMVAQNTDCEQMHEVDVRKNIDTIFNIRGMIYPSSGLLDLSDDCQNQQRDKMNPANVDGIQNMSPPKDEMRDQTTMPQSSVNKVEVGQDDLYMNISKENGSECRVNELVEAGSGIDQCRQDTFKHGSDFGGDDDVSANNDAALNGTSELMCYEKCVAADDSQYPLPHHDAQFSLFVNS